MLFLIIFMNLSYRFQLAALGKWPPFAVLKTFRIGMSLQLINLPWSSNNLRKSNNAIRDCSSKNRSAEISNLCFNSSCISLILAKISEFCIYFQAPFAPVLQPVRQKAGNFRMGSLAGQPFQFCQGLAMVTFQIIHSFPCCFKR